MLLVRYSIKKMDVDIPLALEQLSLLENIIAVAKDKPYEDNNSNRGGSNNENSSI